MENEPKVLTLKGHKKSVLAIGISQDNKYIVSFSKDKVAKVWDILTGKLMLSLENRFGMVDIIKGKLIFINSK